MPAFSAPLPIVLQEKHQTPLRLRKAHLHYVENLYVSTIFVKPNTGFWQLLLYFSVNCFHLILNYFFKKNFKKHPEVFWMYKLNYVLSGNLTVLILGDWILCCGRRVELVLSCIADGLTPSPVTQKPHGKPEPAVLTAGECWWHTVYVQQPRVVQ